MTTPVIEGRETWPPIVVAISGSSGLIGSALVRMFEQRHTEVRRLVRREARAPNEIAWDPVRGTIDAARLDGVDAIINLAGESLAQRWTPPVKRAILDSRVNATALLARTIASMPVRPRVLLSGSAVGIYGSRGDEVLDEASAPGRGFLARVCADWEDAAAPAASAGVRLVLLRSGMVLSGAGGLLRQILIPFRLGLGARLGGGGQWMSWISLDDYARAIAELLRAETVSGPVNVVSSAPVTNETFTHTLGRVLRRPAFLAVPECAMRFAMGEMAEEMALASQRVRPKRLLEMGFDYTHPTLESALRVALRSPRIRPHARIRK